MKVPLFRSRMACCNSACVFITIGPCHATGSFNGAPGAPLKEPVAWHGPIVMNTQAELQQAMRELNNGTFIKTGATGW